VIRAGAIALSLLTVGCAAIGIGEVTTTTTTTSTSTTTTTVPATTTTTAPPVAVSGTVVDRFGRAVVAASVGFGDATGMTDPEGRFSLETHSPGEVIVEKRGWAPTAVAWQETPLAITLEPIRIRGLRVGAEAAGSDPAFQGILDLAAATAVNALVFDTKQEGGKVLYQTAVPAAHQIGAVDPWYDPSARVSAAHEAGLYAITRIVAFEDAYWVAAHPEEKLAGPWAHPASPGARQYAIDLALEACSIGFDEVQFDYVRFPAGRTAEVSGQLEVPQADRVAAIESFLGAARAALAPAGCSMSADIFGIVVSTPDDQGLGQRPEELSPHLDALSPMVYPSHYSPGWLGLGDPNAYPYEVTANAIDAAAPRMAAGVLRPWLQGFWWSNAQIRESIQAAEDRGVGWMLWNVASNFSVEALPRDDEVAG
jgi:hypothetical protein